jgi:MinD superfamily P-loop ATPase
MRKYYEYIIVDTSAGTKMKAVFDVVEQSDLILIIQPPILYVLEMQETMTDEFYKRG